MPVARTPLELKLLSALKRISSYDHPDKLRKRSHRDCGLDANEAIEMAYENVIAEAKNAIHGVRLPWLRPPPL
jgi:hypothetical protein